MKKYLVSQKMGILALFITAAFTSRAQQQYTQTVTTLNKYCNSGCTVIDVAGLNNNSSAIILATPVLASGATSYPFIIGANYVPPLNKWSIYNLNGATMVVGTQFNIEYYTTADANHFVYVVPHRTHSTDQAYIDHAGLNNNPNATVRVFPTTSPVNGALFNAYDVTVAYDNIASKWVIVNNNSATVQEGAAFNVVFSSGSPEIKNPKDGKEINPTIKTPVSTAPGCNCVLPTTLPPNGPAGGDLGGTYPDPRVAALQGNPLSNVQPTVGQVLKWNGTAWAPATDEAGNAGPPPQTIPIQSFYKNTEEESPYLDNSSNYAFVNHTYTITVTKNSRLVISGNFRMKAQPCLACSSTKLGLAIYVNNVWKANVNDQEISSNTYLTTSISNYMFDVTPGTYAITFKATHSWIDGNTPGSVTALFSSIMVLPQ